MKRLTFETLEQLRNDLQAQRASIEGKARATVTVHMGTCGISAGARGIMSALLKALEERGITDVRVAASACAGLCSREPMATVQLPNAAPVKYVDLDAEKIARILEEHVMKGTIVTECALAMGSERVG